MNKLRLTELNEATNIKAGDYLEVSKYIDVDKYKSHKIDYKTIENILRDIITKDLRIDIAVLKSLLYPMLQAKLQTYDKVWKTNHPEIAKSKSPYQLRSEDLNKNKDKWTKGLYQLLPIEHN
jgi:hypothetical protein